MASRPKKSFIALELEKNFSIVQWHVKGLTQYYGTLKRLKKLPKVMQEEIALEYGEAIERAVKASLRLNMTPFGRRPATEHWTRVFSNTDGYPKNHRGAPCDFTGRTYNAIRTRVTGAQSIVEIPGRTEQHRATKQNADGEFNMMRINPEMVKTSADGSHYIRVLTNSGRWITRPVFNNSVYIKPHARRWFGVSNTQFELIRHRINRKYSGIIGREYKGQGSLNVAGNELLHKIPKGSIIQF